MTTLAFAALRLQRGVLPASVTDDSIDTSRLVLRRPVEEDIAALTALADNSRIASKLPDMPHPYTIADAGRFLRRLRDTQSGLTAYAIIDRNSATLIGCGKLQAADASDECRIGLWIGETHWNRGFATEALQALTDHAFSRSPRLCVARTSIRIVNPAAQRVLQKCGFHYAGPGAEADIRTGSLVPVDHYKFDRGIWSAIHAWSRAGAGIKRQLA